MSLFCKDCGQEIDIEKALYSTRYSWGETRAIWHLCPKCGTGNHIRFEKNLISVIRIWGAPGPNWEYMQQMEERTVSSVLDGAGLKIFYKNKNWFIKYRE